MATTFTAKVAAPASKEPRAIAAQRERAPTALSEVQRLHRDIGNRAAGTLLQTKLRIGAPDDAYEVEADRVAEYDHEDRRPGR